METSNRVLDAVLKDFALPHIEERLSRDFFYQLGLGFPEQYGIACRDVRDCVQRAETLGAGPFIHGHVVAPNWVERGKPVSGVKLEVALGYAGDAQLELLGPGSGTRHYARELVDEEIALHHVGIYQRGMREIAERIESAGYPEAVRGGIGIGNALDIDFRYFDARKEHHLYLEILDFSLFGRQLTPAPLLQAYARLRDMLPF